MKVFIDSNIFVAVLTEEEERFSEAKKLLNSDHRIVTSMLRTESFLGLRSLVQVRDFLSTVSSFQRLKT